VSAGHLDGGPETVLVTGAAGLTGRAVCASLERDGTTVIATDLLERSGEGRTILQAGLTDIHRLYAITTERPLYGIIYCGAFPVR